MAPTTTQELSATTLQLWYHYEEIAMHFNGLIIQYRLHLMGGTGAIGTVAFALIQGKDMGAPEVRFYRMLVTSLMLVLVIAAAFLDLAYYSRLLDGAVVVLLELEKTIPQIKMSTTIEKTVGVWGLRTVYLWYTALIVPLGFITAWSHYVFWTRRRSEGP